MVWHSERSRQDEHGQGLTGSETESCGDGAMVDADSFADSDGNKREGARVQGLAVLSSFATTETSEQFKDDEMKGKQPGNGTREPMNKTVGRRGPRTREQTARDRYPRTRGDERSARRECPRSTSKICTKKQIECADEIVCSHLDQGDNQVGNACWKLFCLERGMQRDEQMLGDKTTDGRDDAFNTSSPKQAKGSTFHARSSSIFSSMD